MALPPYGEMMSLIHPEAQAAMTTRRPEILRSLRQRVDGDALLLLNALEVAITELAEQDRRLAETERVLRDLTRTLSGAHDQAERLQHVVQHGGSYANAAARENDG